MHPVNLFIDTLLAVLLSRCLYLLSRLLNPKLRMMDRLDRRIADDCPFFGKR